MTAVQEFGLAIMVEPLPEEAAGRTLAARSAACKAGPDLLTWAATERERRG